jgi:uncharacterized membrane protein
MSEQRPPRAKGVVPILAIAIVFLLTAGTFGTLWVLEKVEHSATEERLTGARTQVQDLTAKGKDAEDRYRLDLKEAADLSLKVSYLDGLEECAVATRKLATSLRDKQTIDIDAAASDLDWPC